MCLFFSSDAFSSPLTCLSSTFLAALVDDDFSRSNISDLKEDAASIGGRRRYGRFAQSIVGGDVRIFGGGTSTAAALLLLLRGLCMVALKTEPASTNITKITEPTVQRLQQQQKQLSLEWLFFAFAAAVATAAGGTVKSVFIAASVTNTEHGGTETTKRLTRVVGSSGGSFIVHRSN